jgi:hypothetical protein
LVKERRINQPAHVKQLMSEQINELRQDDSLDKIQKARAIAYLSTVSLSAYKESEAVDILKRIEKELGIH